ncbi:sulfhydryl oxidase 1-like [Curcuma longa]|uniref:sulfhydryl oxidase 1-like n=1 Tax=Curcuma longa TaxID=136217 RepID=UPI003D9F3B67
MRLADGAFLFSLLVLVLGARGLEAVRSVGEGADLPDAGVDLNVSDFETVLRESPASFAVVEFFAHWCPACRNYKPHYEKVARMFNGPDAVHPGIVLMARVDCAMKINTNLCDRFSVGFYPMLLWGPPAKFVSGRWVPKQENGDLQLIDDGKTADRLLNWINKKLGSSFNFDDARYENENTLAKNASDLEQIARAIYDVEEATALAIDIIIENKMIKPSTRAPFIKFLQLLVAHHPSKRCRRGIADLLVSFDDLLPSGPLSEKAPIDYDILKSYRICGKELPRQYWIFCRGSKDDSRGFSCGLWVLFHSLSVRVADGESQLVFTAIRDFIKNFFVCDDCRRHFNEMSLRLQAPFNTTRGLSLWLWRAHNEVNERLMKVEKDMGTSDPRFPKTIWPPNQLCPSCYASSSPKKGDNAQLDWNEDEVYKFLVNYYGKKLASSSRDNTTLSWKMDDVDESTDTATSSNAVAVPIGAALAIALASCTFGALACFWRVQQKKKKYLHQLHSFKDV